MALLVLLTAAGFVAVGTLLAAIAVCTKGREIILPLVLYPISLPLIAAAVFLTRALLETGVLEFSGFWFVLICVFDVVSLTMSWLLFEYVVGEA